MGKRDITCGRCRTIHKSHRSYLICSREVNNRRTRSSARSDPHIGDREESNESESMSLLNQQAYRLADMEKELK